MSLHPFPRIVMISSTTLDLPEHREHARMACERQGFFPRMMEQLSASRAGGLTRSLEMVDECDIYVLILGVRYGYVPAGSSISITEAEYERAFARGIPLLTFIAHEDHWFRQSDFDSAGAEKLERFRQRLMNAHTVEFFKSADDLGGRIVNALSFHRAAPADAGFHFVAEIPSPPQTYVAHRYSLLESSHVVGRARELDLLTRWIRRSDAELQAVRILVITAMGGMGKSALTWKWFSEMPAEDTARFAGRIWWSFYESDATYENFTARALAYVLRIPLSDALAIPMARREQQLLEVLRQEPFLVCLDGLERILVAYARFDAARLDEEALEAESGAAYSPRLLRKTADWHAGAFLQKLSEQDVASQVLVTTRLYPSDLEGVVEGERAGCKQIVLAGLDDEDGIALWRELGIRGDDEALLAAVRTVQNYPLLMRILAGQIAGFRPAPGDLAAWRASNPSFDPFTLPLVKVRNEVLDFAMTALPPAARLVLLTLAAFRMPVPYDILRPLFVGGGSAFDRDSDLHDALSELEGRGLVGWDRAANRYDLHPVVRRVVWNGVHAAGRELVYEKLHEHLAASPAVADVRASSVDQLAPAVELYYTLIALGRHTEAYGFFNSTIYNVLLVRMNRFRIVAQMLESLFPDGIANAPRLSNKKDIHSARWALAYAYHYAGQPGRAMEVWRSLADSVAGDRSRALHNYADSLLSLGRLRESEKQMEECVSREKNPEERGYALNRAHLAFLASIRGATETADTLFKEALLSYRRWPRLEHPADFSPMIQLISHLLRHGRLEEARAMTRRGISTSALTDVVQIRIDALTMLGRVLTADQHHDEAEAALTAALASACEIGSEAEIEITISIADLYRRRGWLARARDLLSGVWEPLEREQLRLRHADARNVLAEIELAAERRAEAIDAATTAYRLAWCDGPPYAYSHALERARAVLASCDASEPLAVVEDFR